jgi:hypothetical protein
MPHAAMATRKACYLQMFDMPERLGLRDNHGARSAAQKEYASQRERQELATSSSSSEMIRPASAKAVLAAGTPA